MMNPSAALAEPYPFRNADTSGFSIIELMIGVAILGAGLLTIALMFSAGYGVIDDAGDLTMSITGARQVLEEIHSLPFDNIIGLDGFDTDDPASLPDSGPERELARRWRYSLTGAGDGFTYVADETSRWSTLTTGSSTSTRDFNGRGQISVVAQSPTLRLVTVTILTPSRDIELATLITRM